LETKRKRLMPLRLVCVGGGHANCQLIQAFNPGNDLIEGILISDSDVSWYSGMIPGVISGAYQGEKDAAYNIKHYAIARGWKFIKGRVESINSTKKLVTYVEDHQSYQLSYDLLILNIGSQTNVPFDISDFGNSCIATRPIAQFEKQLLRFEETLLKQSEDNKQWVKVVVLGGGAGGIEMMFNLEARFRKGEYDFGFDYTLIQQQDRCLPALSLATSQRVENELRKRKINLIHNHRAIASEKGFVVLSNTSSEGKDEIDKLTNVPFDLLILATGGAAFPWLKAQTDLQTDSRGFVSVKDTLQSVSSEAVFAAGDCASMTTFKGDFPPKAGVYAIRQGQHLVTNVRLMIDELISGKLVTDIWLREYVPQSDFLSLINLGEGDAIGMKFGLTFQGWWVWILKDLIDRKWIRSFQS